MGELQGPTPITDIFAHVDGLRRSRGSGDELVDLLAEQSPIYAGMSTNEAERLRGYVLASFESTGLPALAMGFIVEELESGLNPHVVAAAAKALRGARDDLPPHIVSLLLDAIERIRQSDDLVCFDQGAVGAAPTTALTELFRTLAWLGPRAAAAVLPLRAMLERRPPVFSPAAQTELELALVVMSCGAQPAMHACCAVPCPPVSASSCAGVDVNGIELQDQDGSIFSFGEFFRGRPSVLTFFYTRCMNPNKCSLTITKLGRLQRQVCEEGLHDHFNIAAVSYDPTFDLPRRLRPYGTNRGMSFDDRCRMMRTTGPLEPLRQRFDLGVGYGSTTVNRHRLDVLVLDTQGRLSARFTRIQWSEEDVFNALKSASAHL